MTRRPSSVVPPPSFGDATPGIAVAPDGEPLSYRVHGKLERSEGAPILVHAGLVSTTEHWPYFVEHFSQHRAVVTWLYRGHGRTPPPRDFGSLTVEGMADDGHVVSRAAGGGPKVVAGLSFGVQVALEHLRRHPDDVKALVLMCGTWGHPLDRVTSSPRFRHAVARALRLAGRSGRVGKALTTSILASPLLRQAAFLLGGAHRESCPRGVLDELFANVGEMHPRVVGEIMAAYVEHSAEDLLGRIRVPTLIVAGGGDQLTPTSIAERMHQAIVGSRLVVFPGHTHLVQVERPGDVHDAIDTFFADYGL